MPLLAQLSQPQPQLDLPARRSRTSLRTTRASTPMSRAERMIVAAFCAIQVNITIPSFGCAAACGAVKGQRAQAAMPARRAGCGVVRLGRASR